MKDFEEKVNKVKNQINDAKLSQSFKDNLKLMMDKEYYKNDITSKVSLIDKNNDNNSEKNKSKLWFSRKVATIFACFIIVSSVAFAGDWENFFAKLFYNMDSKMSLAIEDGYIQNIDMDYVECNGVKIKVDYLLFDEQEIYISNNINMQEDFDEVYLKNFILKDDMDNIIFDSTNNFNNVSVESKNKNLSQNTSEILNRFYKYNSKFENMNNISMEIFSIAARNKEGVKEINGTWKINLNVDDMYKNSEQYDINKVIGKIKEYDIKFKNHKLDIELQMNDNKEKTYEFNKSDIYFEDENENKYYPTNEFDIYDNILKFSIKLNKNTSVEKSKLIIEYCENKKKNKIILYLKDTNG